MKTMTSPSISQIRKIEKNLNKSLGKYPGHYLIQKFHKLIKEIWGLPG